MDDQKEAHLAEQEPEQSEPNRQFIQYLKAALEIAEKGGIQGGVILGMAPESTIHWFSMPKGAESALIGEIALLKLLLENTVLMQRQQAAVQRRPGLVLPGRH